MVQCVRFRPENFAYETGNVAITKAHSNFQTSYDMNRSYELGTDSSQQLCIYIVASGAVGGTGKPLHILYILSVPV